MLFRSRNFENTLNVALIRNPRDQFESYIASKMPIFLIMNLIIISRKETISSFKSLVKEIDIPLFYDDNIYKEIQFYKSIVKKISLENHYKIFFTIWLESFIHAKKYADVIVNTNLLNQDENYKKNIEIKLNISLEDFKIKTYDKYQVSIKDFTEIEKNVYKEILNEKIFDKEEEKLLFSFDKYYEKNEKTFLRKFFFKKNKEFKVISVVTPSYNHSEFILDTIDSILNQKGDFLIDYIIMDGGSSDDTCEKVDKIKSGIEQNSDYIYIKNQKFYFYHFYI